jgi:hypothetical protein
MTKIIEIEMCSLCPEYFNQWCHHPNVPSLPQNTVMNESNIPSWCPLPDKPLVRGRSAGDNEYPHGYGF